MGQRRRPTPRKRRDHRQHSRATGSRSLKKLLFVHPNFPGQWREISPALAAQGFDVTAIGKLGESTVNPPGVRVFRYRNEPFSIDGMDYPPLAGFAESVRQGKAAAALASELRQSGYVPDVIIGHTGWGDMLFLKNVWPEAKVISYLEYYYKDDAEDANFDPEFPPRKNEREFTRLRNLNQVMAFENSDVCITATEWQRSLFPPKIQKDMVVIHEGVATEKAMPNPNAAFALPNGRILTRNDKVITYCARNLEPYRGFHSFMRALPLIQQRDPDVMAIVVGGTRVSYGRRPLSHADWKAAMLQEMADRLDLSRVAFTGRLPYGEYINALAVSSVHTYLTYPFVASWSLVEAMAVGCNIVAADVAPARELLGSYKTHKFADFFDFVAIADAVISFLNTRHELDKPTFGQPGTLPRIYKSQTAATKYEELALELCR